MTYILSFFLQNQLCSQSSGLEVLFKRYWLFVTSHNLHCIVLYNFCHFPLQRRHSGGGNASRSWKGSWEVSIYQHPSMCLNCLQFCHPLCLKCHSFAGEKAQALFFWWFSLCRFYKEKEICNSTLCFCHGCYSPFWGVWGCVTVIWSYVAWSFQAQQQHSSSAEQHKKCQSPTPQTVSDSDDVQPTKVRLFVHVINTFISLYVYTCMCVCTQNGLFTGETVPAWWFWWQETQKEGYESMFVTYFSTPSSNWLVSVITCQVICTLYCLLACKTWWFWQWQQQWEEGQETQKG